MLPILESKPSTPSPSGDVLPNPLIPESFCPLCPDPRLFNEVPLPILVSFLSLLFILSQVKSSSFSVDQSLILYLQVLQTPTNLPAKCLQPHPLLPVRSTRYRSHYVAIFAVSFNLVVKIGVLTFGVFETASPNIKASSKEISDGMELYRGTPRSYEPWSPHCDRREKNRILFKDLDKALSTLQRGHGGVNGSASRL
jgi:hypothetical protein